MFSSTLWHETICKTPMDWLRDITTNLVPKAFSYFWLPNQSDNHLCGVDLKPWYPDLYMLVLLASSHSAFCESIKWFINNNECVIGGTIDQWLFLHETSHWKYKFLQISNAYLACFAFRSSPQIFPASIPVTQSSWLSLLHSFRELLCIFPVSNYAHYLSTFTPVGRSHTGLSTVLFV